MNTLDIDKTNFIHFTKYIIIANILYLIARLSNPSNIKPMIILLAVFSLYIIYKWKSFTEKLPVRSKILFKWLIFYLLITFFRGFIVPHPNYTVIMSSGITVTCVMLFMVIGTRLDMVRTYIYYFILLALPFSFFLYSIAMVGTNDFPHFLSIFQLLLLVTPFLKSKKLILLIYIINIMSFFYDMGDRSNILNICGTLSILFLYRFILRKSFIRKFKYLYMLLPLIPLALVIAALYFQFNFFDFLSGQEADNDMVADSRTGVYMDVWNGLSEKNAFIWGLGSSGKYQTHLVDTVLGEAYFAGRSFCETNILNVLSISGLFGTALYVLFLLSCIFYAIKYSKNDFAMLVALYACLKFCMIFIEEIQDFSLNHISFALTFGLCINNGLLKMNNDEIKEYFRTCFPKLLVGKSRHGELV